MAQAVSGEQMRSGVRADQIYPTLTPAQVARIAAPSTRCLDGCLALDAKGFIKTGPDLSPDDLAAARWPALRISSRRVSPGYSRSATSAPGA